MTDWKPPAGAVQAESGCWESSGSVYVAPAVWADWEGEAVWRNRQAIARAERNRWPVVEVTVAECKAQIHALARELDAAREELEGHIGAVLMLDTLARRAA